MVDKRSLRYKFGMGLYGLTGLIAIYALFTVGSQVMQPYIDKNRTDKIASELAERYGLVVRYGDPSAFNVSPEPVAHMIHGFEMEPTNPSAAHNAIVGIRDGLSKYPAELIKNNLAAVFIAGSIIADGIDAGGTVLGKWIYVSADQLDVSRNPETYAETLHHEFSSILMREHNFPTILWALANKPGFKYLEKGMDIIKAAGRDNRQNPEKARQWYDVGLVHDYGMSSMTNDVNTYAELAMTHPDKLIQLSKQYPRIMYKTKIFVDFYTSLTPDLGVYFKSVGLDDIFRFVSD